VPRCSVSFSGPLQTFLFTFFRQQSNDSNRTALHTLISCTGEITRAELANLPTPPATATHIPIPHAAVVASLVETLSHRQLGVVGEEFAVSSDAMEMFGVLDLEAGFEGCRFAIGIRNANNKRLWLAQLDSGYSCVTILRFVGTIPQS
jgi:hypothetical protein